MPVLKAGSQAEGQGRLGTCMPAGRQQLLQGSACLPDVCHSLLCMPLVQAARPAAVRVGRLLWLRLPAQAAPLPRGVRPFHMPSRACPAVQLEWQAFRQQRVPMAVGQVQQVVCLLIAAASAAHAQRTRLPCAWMPQCDGIRPEFRFFLFQSIFLFLFKEAKIGAAPRRSLTASTPRRWP